MHRSRRLLALGAFVLLIGAVVQSGAGAGPQGPSVRAVPASGVVATDLEQTFASARHLSHDAVGGIRPGTLQVALETSTGTTWAAAAFDPADAAGPQTQTGFQDGAGTGVFTQTPGQPWRMVGNVGLLGCGSGIPADIAATWHLADAASCRAADATSQQAATQRIAAAPSADIGQKIAKVALGQVGVGTTPVVTDFNTVDCDPYSTLVGAFSPNSNGCGYDAALKVRTENEAWCSDFAKWSWQKAGITADMNTIDAGANSFYRWALAHGQTPVPNTGTPAPGDAVLFYGAGAVTPTRYAQHVGIVESVNADGTVNLVNGDFLGDTNITVQYNTNLNLTQWAPTVWGAGEQWLLVKPPTDAQKSVPVAAAVGPRVAVAGTKVDFAAVGAVAGGTVTDYQWNFGDGRDTNATGAKASQVFPVAGLYTVNVDVVSSLGTVVTKTWNVDVVAASSNVVSSPSNFVWYTSIPVNQYAFIPSADGALAVESWDGASWLQQAVPGQPAAGTDVTALSYSDAALGDRTAPHAYYRDASGALAETFAGNAGWQTQQIGGSPAADSAIVATTTAGDGTTSASPEVFSFNAAGQLTESAKKGSSWITSTLPGPATATPGSLALTNADVPAGVSQSERLFYLDSHGNLTATQRVGKSWVNLAIHNPLGVAAGSHLAALPSGASGTQVFFTDGSGKLASATTKSVSAWTVAEIAGSAAQAPAPASAMTATSYLLPSGELGDEVVYLTASGQPTVTMPNGAQWQTTALPGTATAIRGVSAYPAANQPLQVLFAAQDGSLGLDASIDGGTTWTTTTLPNTPATFVDTILLYAATPADYASALSAATAAGLPASQVTQNFAKAWGAVLSGDYLVISAGQAATNALYTNPCGWTNPSADDPGSTPFSYSGAPLNQLPSQGAFERAVAVTASQTPDVITDLAYYAAHGAFPSGVTSLPPLAHATSACLGSPS